MKVKTAVLLATVALAMAMGVEAAEPGDRVLPFYKSMAGDKELPLPFGIGATFYYQEQDYSLDRLSISSPFAAIDPSLIAAVAPGVEIDNELVEVNMKMDAWLTPFLNVHGLLGYVNGETEVSIGQPFGSINVDYDGLVYGVGATAVGGVKDVFASFTGVWTWSDLDTSGSSVESLVLMPRLGYSLPEFGATKAMQIWIGAMYLDIEEEHDGTATVSTLGPINYDVDLQQDEDWSYLIGAHIALTDRLGIEVEGGFGDRTSGTASVGLRF